METLNFNKPIIMGLFEKATQMATKTHEVDSCLELYETFTQEEWREMVLGIIAHGQHADNRFMFGENSHKEFYGLPLFSGGGSWGMHEPMPFGIATEKYVLSEGASIGMRKKLKIAFDLIACEALDKKNDVFLNWLLLSDLAGIIDCEILLRIFHELKEKDCSIRAFGIMLRQVKYQNWSNMMPFSFWEKMKEEEKFNQFVWLAVCFVFKRKDVFMKELAFLKEWPLTYKDSGELYYHTIQMMNEDTDSYHLLECWPTYTTSMQQSLLLFIEEYSKIEKGKYSTLFIKRNVLEELKKLSSK